MSDLDDLAAAAGNRPTSNKPLGLDRIYHLSDGGARSGPFSEAELYAMVNQRRISISGLVWSQGWDHWYPIDQLVVPPLVTPTHQYFSSRSGYREGMATNRVLAGVLAILFPPIHKFVMGFVGTGILQLVIMVFTCGAGYLIGLIEGIIYLSKSEEQFYLDYHVNKRTWF